MAKNTGMVRKIDELGRIVIPKEIRKSINIKNGEEIEIYVENDTIILKKYYRLLEFQEYAKQILNIITKLINSTIIITDREKILEVTNTKYNNLINKNLSKFVIEILENRKIMEGQKLNITKEDVINNNYLINPIVVNTDLVGSVICFNEKEISREDKLAINILVSLLENKIDSN